MNMASFSLLCFLNFYLVVLLLAVNVFSFPLIASLLCLQLSLYLFICNPSLHRNQRDFQDGLPLINLSGCAQPSFPARIETRNERLQSEPFVKQEGVYTALCPQSVMVVIQKMKRKLPNVIQM